MAKSEVKCGVLLSISGVLAKYESVLRRISRHYDSFWRRKERYRNSEEGNVRTKRLFGKI